MSFRLAVCEAAEPAFKSLNQLPTHHVKFICSLVFSYIVGDSTTITFDKLKMSTGVKGEVLEQCICAVGYILSECLKNHINPFDFEGAIADAQLNQDIVVVLSQTYDHIKMSTKKRESSFSISDPSTSQYSDMKWRLDVEISNRSLYRVYKPSYLLEIESISDGKKVSEYFECDYSCLKNIHAKLKNSIQSDWDLCCKDFHYLLELN